MFKRHFSVAEMLFHL